MCIRDSSRRKGSIPGSNCTYVARITPAGGEAPRSTKFWVGSSGSEAIPPGGSIPEETSLVTPPGMGSLSVTGPTGRGGAKPEIRLSSVASEYLRPPTSEAKPGIHSMAGGEVLNSEGRSRTVSGSRVIRSSAILLDHLSHCNF